MALLLWFADAILTKGIDFTVDGTIKQVIHDEFKFSDVHLQDILHLEEGPRLDFTADASLLLRPNNDFSVDALIPNEDVDLDFTVDANVQLATSTNYEVDAFLQLETDHDFTVDAIIVEREQFLWDADSILSSRLPLEFLVDPITLGTLEHDYLLDSFIQDNSKTTDFTIDSIVDQRIAMRVDGFLKALGQELDFTVDSILIVRKPGPFQVDGNLQKDGFLPFNLDAFIEKETEHEFTVDALVVPVNAKIDVCTVHFCIPTTPALFFTVDAITPAKIDFQWNVDSHIEAQGFFDNFTVDALIMVPTPFGWTVDASIIKPSQFNACPSLTRQSLNCTSVIRRRGA